MKRFILLLLLVVAPGCARKPVEARENQESRTESRAQPTKPTRERTRETSKPTTEKPTRAIKTPLELCGEVDKRYRIKVNDLVGAYKENPIAADKEYKNETLLFETIVYKIDRDLLGMPCVVCLSSYEGATGNVYCYTEKNNKEVAELKPHDWILIRGVCTGKTIGFVSLQKCEIILHAPTEKEFAKLIADLK